MRTTVSTPGVRLDSETTTGEVPVADRVAARRGRTARRTVRGQPYSPRSLYGAALRMTRTADTEDLVRGLRGPSPVSTRSRARTSAHGYRILTNTTINHYRKRQRQPPQYPTDGILDWQLAAAAANTSTGLRSAGSGDEACRTTRSARPGRTARGFPDGGVLRRHGPAYKEIAEILDTRWGRDIAPPPRPQTAPRTAA